MNTVSFTPLPDTDQVRVTIHSEGERDQSALVTRKAFIDLFVGVTSPSEWQQRTPFADGEHGSEAR